MARTQQLGSTTAGTVVATGATLEIQSTTDIAASSEPLVLNGTGANGTNGALEMITGGTGSSSLASNILLASDSRLPSMPDS